VLKMGKEEASSGADARPKWDNRAQYLLSCIGFAVGLGNIWRFPYLCQIYGGGAFLIPYLIALVFEGLPLLYLELAIGQRLRKGSIGVWTSISPLLGGVGMASMIVSFCVSLFYNTIIAWVLWYFFHSFQDPLPWSQCPLNENSTGYNEECEKSTPVNYFWYRNTLNITPDIETSGSLQWWLVVCLATAWSVVYICFIRGIESMGKAVYVTATFPYLVLTIFLIRGLTLEGATDGLLYLFTPDWNTLMNPQVWLDAATQIFFSLSVAFGGLISFASYNEEKNNCERDALIVGIINSATSLYASISVFSILGFKATNAYKSCLNQNILTLTNDFEIPDKDITLENYDEWITKLNSTYPDAIASLRECELQTFLDQVLLVRTGLAFIAFTEAVIEMPGSQVWSILFFVMLFTLGLSSMFGNMEGVITPLKDLNVVPKWIPQEVTSGILCLVSFLVALIFTQGSGNYWVEVFNGYVGSVPLLVIAFFEIIAVSYIYGIRNFSDDLEYMNGSRPNIFWKACWLVISPVINKPLGLLPFGFSFSPHVRRLSKANQLKYFCPLSQELFPQTESKPYPDWVFAIIILLCVIPLLPIPIVALYHLTCRLSRRRSNQSYPNAYSNDGFQIETQNTSTQSA
uniref:Transporter n=1 Tax=Takifugu rubripes TaxID=31033 RepID=A0A674N2A5_TAKRU